MKKFASALLFSMLALAPVSAFAVDTTEPIDPNTLEVDPSFTIHNIHKDGAGVGAELSVVYGVMENFNIGATISYGSEVGFVGGGIGVNTNFLYTAVDTDNVDLDVMVDLGFDGGFYMTPNIELNYDAAPDMSAWGLFFKLGLPIYGADEHKNHTDFGLDVAVGGYVTIAGIHQLLLEGGFSAENLAKKAGDADIAENPYIALGYNVQITDTFELTSELAFHLPRHDHGDHFNAAITIGGIFGMLGQ